MTWRNTRLNDVHSVLQSSPGDIAVVLSDDQAFTILAPQNSGIFFTEEELNELSQDTVDEVRILPSRDKHHVRGGQECFTQCEGYSAGHVG